MSGGTVHCDICNKPATHIETTQAGMWWRVQHWPRTDRIDICPDCVPKFWQGVHRLVTGLAKETPQWQPGAVEP